MPRPDNLSPTVQVFMSMVDDVAPDLPSPTVAAVFLHFDDDTPSLTVRVSAALTAEDCGHLYSSLAEILQTAAQDFLSGKVKL